MSQHIYGSGFVSRLFPKTSVGKQCWKSIIYGLKHYTICLQQGCAIYSTVQLT